MIGNTIANAARCQMNNPYDHRPNVTIVRLPSIRCGVSGRSSTSGASSAAATTAPITVFTVNWLTVPGVNPSGPASGRGRHREGERRRSPPSAPAAAPVGAAIRSA